MTFDGAGNTLDDAKKFNITYNTQTFTDWLGSTDTNDYYRFTLGSTSTLKLDVSGLTDNANVRLLNSDGDTITGDYSGGTTAESISRTLDAGDYYIRVYPYGSGSNTSYDLTVSATALGQPQEPNPEPWTQQLGTEGDDFSNGIAVDSAGNVYITGFTEGSLGGDNAGYYDTWLAKYDSGGNELWKTQLGTTGDDFSYSVAVDDSGNAYITGHSEETWLGGTDNGWGDYNALIAKYDSNGNLLWTDQVDYVGENEYSYSIAVDSTNNVYMTGVVDDIQQIGAIPNTWLSKHSSDGEQQWKTKLNAPAENITVDTDGAGNVYVAGYFEKIFGGNNTINAWVSKHDSSGQQLSIKGLNTSDFDIFSDIDIDITGNVYITGSIYEPLQESYSGNYDALVAKYDITGELIWSKQLDITGDDFTSNVVVSDDGNVYITGETQGTIEAGNPETQNDWVAKYGSDGSLIWTQELDIASENFVTDMTVGDTGNIFLTGETENWSNANSFGDVDTFVAKYVEPI